MEFLGERAGVLKRRIVFLSAKSGGGHDGAARAMSQLIQARYQDQYEFDVIDIYNDKIDKALPFFSRIRHHSDFIWMLFLWITNNRFFVALARGFMRRYMLRQIKKQLPGNVPIDLLIAVHFNPAQIVAALAAELPDPPRTVILATDYDPHWSWIGGSADAIIVASQSGKNKALTKGYHPNQILELQVLPNEQTVPGNVQVQDAPLVDNPFRLLMVSGQDGSNSRKILSIIENIDRADIAGKVSLDIYCGKNEELKKAVDALSGKLRSLKVQAHGFVVGLHQNIARANLILLRASPQVLSECISAGVPVIAFDWSVHEKYQAEMINREQIGFASKDKQQVLAHLIEIVGSAKAYELHQAKVKALAATFNRDVLLEHILFSSAEQKTLSDELAANHLISN